MTTQINFKEFDAKLGARLPAGFKTYAMGRDPETDIYTAWLRSADKRVCVGSGQTAWDAAVAACASPPRMED